MSDLITTLHRNNLIFWQESVVIERMATPEQRERWVHGTLPVVDLLHLARTELFRVFAGFVKRQALQPWDIPHPRTGGGWACATYGEDLDTKVQWQTREAEPTTLEWMTLMRIRSVATGLATTHPWLAQTESPVTVNPREHRGVCQVCGRDVSHRSALMSIQWAGRTLSREYLL